MLGYPWHRYSGPGNLPQLDISLSTLLDDLDERGLLDTTLVVVMGEFGRTPRINNDADRDHYRTYFSRLPRPTLIADGQARRQSRGAISFARPFPRPGGEPCCVLCRFSFSVWR